MDADVLLLRLYHPDPLLPHRPDDTEDVDVLGHENLLQYPVEGDEGATTADTGTAMDDYGPLIGPDAFPKRAHEPRQCLGRTRNAKVWPGSKVEVLYHSLYLALRTRYSLDLC